MKDRIIIAAITNNFGLGYKNQLLYRIKGDLKRFKELTTGNIVIMGRNTYDSIGKALPNRKNIVITSRDINDDVHCVKSIQEAFELAEKLEGEKVYVIGGGQVYKAAIQWVTTIELTVIDAKPKNVDTFFPAIRGFVRAKFSDIMTENGIDYKFVTYKRNPTTSTN